MKKTLLQISGTIHVLLFLGWVLPAMVAFAMGTEDYPTWLAMLGMSCIIAHVCWGMLEAEWLYQQSKR